MIKKIGKSSHRHVEDLNDSDWAREQLFLEVSAMRDVGAWEEYLYAIMVYHRGANRRSWQAKTQSRRAICVGDAIDLLIKARRIKAMPSRTQASGRRGLVAVNILDTIVAALEDSDADA